MKKLIIFLTLLFLFSCAGSQTRTTTVDFTCNCPDDREFSAQDVAKIVKFALEAIQKAPFLQSKAYLEKNPRWMLAKDMKNDTDEHINTRIILEKIRTNLMRENGIPFVDDEALRSILINKKYQESGTTGRSRCFAFRTDCRKPPEKRLNRARILSGKLSISIAHHV
jgi:hypothetical protein